MAETKAFVNGIMYSWANARFVVEGEAIYGITAIKFDSKMNMENNYGQGQKPIGRGLGNIESNGNISIYQEEMDKLQEKAEDGMLFNLDPFDIPVTFFTKDKQTTYILKNVQFMNNGIDIKSGDTSVQCSIDLIISEVVKQ